MRVSTSNTAADATVGGHLAQPRRRRLAFLAVISTNQFKNGTHVEVDGTIFKIVEFQHVKPGKGGAFVRTKLKRSSPTAP